ncbi:MAG TPA: aldo/keto reductase [Myxococcales bacterium]|nr:aldo/keto reductase [Myxococcales bacterium]
MATRRRFLQAAAASVLVTRSSRAAQKQAGGAPVGAVPKGKYKVPEGAALPTRELGRTGVRVSIVGLGGYHLGLPSEAEAIRIVRRALEHGMNFLDNCWDYNDGESERRMGKALRDGYRAKAFLMTKLDGRTAKSAADQLEQSLQRLQTDVIDLVQIHEVIRKDDPERCFAKGGAIEALDAARKAGKLRYIGFTGHKDPDIHRHMLDVARANGFHFDTVQMPVNVLDAHYRSFEREIIPVALKDGVAVLGMKPMGAGLILESGAASAEECLCYAMSVPGVSVTITGCDSEGVLEQALHLALGFKPMPDDERAALLSRSAKAAQKGKWEKFKTTHQFDGTEQHKQWLTSARL